ncbi:MAG: TRAP transporter small permease [Alphaproteobacteria bacterium]|nr:TRAP transporter small permease [Alphaproteobacteria bacterium]
MKALDVLRRADRLLGRIELVLAAVCLLVSTAGIAIGVFFRSLLDHPLAWTNELAVLGLVWLTFIGASAVYKERGHIAVDAVSHLLPTGSRRVLAATLIVVMGVSIALVGWHMLTLIPLQHRKMISGLDLPRSWHGIPVLWMCASMVLSSLRQLFEASPEPAHAIQARG